MPAAGTVITGKRIETPLTLSKGDITIEKSCIRPTSVGRGFPMVSTLDTNTCGSGNCAPPATVTIRDSEIDGSKLSTSDAASTTGFYGIANLQRNYVHDMGSGLAIIQTGKRLSSLVEQNYVTGLRAYGDPATTGNHSDAFTLRGFDTSVDNTRQAIVRNNRFDCDSANASGAMLISTIADDVNNLLIEGNLLEGGGYHLSLGQDQGGNTYGNSMRVVDNRLAPDGWITYVQDGRGWSEWTDNYLDDPSQPDHRGRSIPKPLPIVG